MRTRFFLRTSHMESPLAPFFLTVTAIENGAKILPTLACARSDTVRRLRSTWKEGVGDGRRHYKEPRFGTKGKCIGGCGKDGKTRNVREFELRGEKQH